MKDFKTIQKELAQPFAPEDLEWRLQFTLKERGTGLAVPYVTSRAIQDRLDAVVGSENWRNEYQDWHSGGKKGVQICGISIYLEERNEWVTKWDGAEDTDIESVKGGLSDSMKRAAVQWGVGRVLYRIPSIWVNVEPRGKSCVIKDSERGKLDQSYLAALKRLGLTPAKPGGLQSELSPGAVQTKPAQQDSEPQNTRTERHTVQSASRTDPVSQPVAAEFTVLDVKVQPGMRGQTTSLTLQRSADQKTLRAFLNGVDQNLRPGAALVNASLQTRVQNHVTYLVLEHYDILPRYDNAA